MPATGPRTLRAALVAVVLLGAAAAPVRSDTQSEIADVLAAMTGALADADAGAFLKPIDRKCPAYDTLSNYIPELLRQGTVSSAIEFLKNDGDERRRSVQLDWYLESHSEDAAGPVVRRRVVVDCVFEKQGRSWRIVSLSPVSLFAPQNYE